MSDINERRRQLILSATGAIAFPGAGMAAGQEEARLEVQVIDSGGRPVTHSMVWAYVLPREGPLALERDDLWRVATRFQDSGEQVTRHNNILPKMIVLPLTDSDGRLRSNLEYRLLEGSLAKPPSRMQVGLVVLKRGYASTRHDFPEGGPFQSRITLGDRLKREQGQEILEEFDRLRFSVSDTQRIASSFAEGVDGVREQFLALADRAERERLPAVAARILARVSALPGQVMSNNKVIGFKQRDWHHPASVAARKRAYELAPQDPYVAAAYLFSEGGRALTSTLPGRTGSADEGRQTLELILPRVHALMRDHGERVWPEFHRQYAIWHRHLPEPQARARVAPLMEKLFAWEPKLATREQLLKAGN